MRWVFIILLVLIIYRLIKPLLVFLNLKRKIEKNEKKKNIREKINSMDILDADYEDR